MLTWPELLQELQGFRDQLEVLLRLLLQPWGAFQIGLLALLLLLAWFCRRLAEPRMEAWLRGREETSRRRLRFLALILRRLQLIAFVALAWSAVAIMRAYTWPSRSYVIAVVASLATVWLVVTLSSRLIQNRLLARTVALLAWTFAALTILDLLPQTLDMLDAAAFMVGDLRISLLLLLKAALTLAVLFWLAATLSGLTERRVARVEDMSPSMRVLTGKLVRVLLFTLAFVIALQSIGFDLTTLTIFSGAIGLGLGFGLQKVVSNLVSGVILLLDKSIKPGDVISLGQTFGWITSLGARYVSVVTRDGREFLIPNEDLITGQVINWSYSDQLVRLEVEFGVAYNSDPHRVRRLASEAAVRPERVVETPAPVCHLTGFGDSSIDFVLRFWIRDPANGVVNIKGQVLLALWDALKAEGIEIPYPVRRVLLDRTEPAAS